MSSEEIVKEVNLSAALNGYDEYFNTKKYVYNNNEYTIIKYNKEKLKTIETSDSDNVGQIRFGTTSASATSFAYFPMDSTTQSDGSEYAHSNGYSGDVWFEAPSFNDTSNYSNRPKNEMNYFDSTIKHEIGHVLGLKHPFEDTYGYVENDVVGIPQTLMSYSEYDGAPASGGFNLSWAAPDTYMVNDIKALQFYYGVNEQTASGNTTYNTSTLANSDGIIYMTIWDAGGIDTIDLTGWTSGASIDLNDAGKSMWL